MGIIELITSFFVANWPFIAATAPSVAVALTKVDTLPKWLSTALQVVSVLSHKDAPGTVKLPGTVNKIPVHSLPKRKLRDTVKALALFGALSASGAGCAGVQAQAATASAEIDCEADKIPQQVEVLLPTVISIVCGDLTNAQETVLLDALRDVGEEAFACALREAARGFAKLSMTEGAPVLRVNSRGLVLADNADEAATSLMLYITSRGYRFVGGP